MITFYERMTDLFAANIPFVAVTVVDTIGSVPNQSGAKMLVTAEGLLFGTVGGGKVETKAIAEAKRLLTEDHAANGDLTAGEARTHFVNWILERDVGMTCGGSVKLYFEAFNTHPWNITIYGAGHCANALVSLLTNLDCRIRCIDPRPEWLAKLPESSKLTKILVENMPESVTTIPDNSFILLMTMGHSSDKPILIELLRNWSTRQYPYLGVIGSDAKAARLGKDIVEAGLPKELRQAFFCPMGLPVGNNQPQEIAVSIAAQLLEVRDKVWGHSGASLAEDVTPNVLPASNGAMHDSAGGAPNEPTRSIQSNA